MTERILFDRFFLLAGVCSLALTQACSDDDPTPPPGPGPVDPAAVAFAPSFMGTSACSDLGVFAFATGSDMWSDQATPDFMHDQLVENRNGEWSYSLAKNWPDEPSHKVSFFAYGPRATADNGMTVTDASHAGTPVLTYSMPDADDCFTDIFLAAPIMNLSGSEEPVAPKLRSVMSRLGFRIKGQGEKITSIAIRGIQWEANIPLNAVDQGTQTWSVTSDFTTTEYGIRLEYDEGEEFVTATPTMTDVTAEDGYLYLIPQNLTYNARIVVTIDGEKFGFPIEDVFQIQPGEEYTIDLTIPGEKPLNFTDNAMPAFLIAPVDAAEAANISWADAQAACAEGYRLPTYNEGLMILFYMNGIGQHNFRFASYWTQTTSLEDPTGESAMGYNIMPWMGLYMPKIGITAARCVKDAPAGGKKYPYVDTSHGTGR